ncbi:Pimeloyl-ACP methyl ester carboxylesterase [Jatrophihabitans endophyticus]|uniref:Pimeloyl-ACP methyl ester carboxylesterase n=2 Tax=Jatrophihabitans endophyticus TaxID=1206085 RepID=A0A1M5CTY5_9ACTN|nr:Pimeloyl-ACP methyl ester carboxylesterase [Jatrophihabitans endophyticus]
MIDTPVLAIEYTDEGDGPPVVLVHGWPDAARGWHDVRSGLIAAGHRVVVPSLRGSGGTRFHDDTTLRDGSGAALARDVLDLADLLGLGRFAVVGHDWGARTAYTLAAVAPHRVSSISTLALGYQPRGRFAVPASFRESRLFWYQWLMCVDAGAAAVAADPVGFAREQWDTWSPAGWYEPAEFEATAASFANPDWVAVTLHAYRSRFREDEPRDPRYDDVRAAVAGTDRIDVPTLMVHGGADECDPPETSWGQAGHFGSYRRVVVDGAGHFPHREDPAAVLAAVTEHLARHPPGRE